MKLLVHWKSVRLFSISIMMYMFYLYIYKYVQIIGRILDLKKANIIELNIE